MEFVCHGIGEAGGQGQDRPPPRSAAVKGVHGGKRQNGVLSGVTELVEARDLGKG